MYKFQRKKKKIPKKSYMLTIRPDPDTELQSHILCLKHTYKHNSFTLTLFSFWFTSSWSLHKFKPCLFLPKVQVAPTFHHRLPFLPAMAYKPSHAEWACKDRGRPRTWEEMATHSCTLAWKSPRTEEPCRLQSMGSQRVGHDWATSLHFMIQKKTFDRCKWNYIINLSVWCRH